jgi:hypothetical protein
MPTVLKASGISFDVDAFLKKSKLKPYLVYHKGECRFRRTERMERHKKSGLCLDMTDSGFEDFPRQVRQTIYFLKRNHKELKKLTTFSGVVAVIDFGFARRDTVVQCDLLPAELVRLAGSIGLAIEMSLYRSAKKK